MISNLYGNPHSASSPSALAGHRVDVIRQRALRFFNADPAEWDLVFTANATASIKMVMECFRDHAAVSNTPVWYGYHRDSHTSVVGGRELTKLHRCFSSDEEVDIWINSGGLGGPRARQLGLFAYPGQSNMTGRRLPLSWYVKHVMEMVDRVLTRLRPGRIRKTFHKAATYTLLDAAALASTSPLDLADTTQAPDFVALSFYKIFGFPNIGALLVQKRAQHVLQDRCYFGGGTVDMIISINDTWHASKDTSLHDRLEDGTLPFHSIFALDHAMDVHERLYGPDPMKFISMHTARLGKQIYDALIDLRHTNGAPLARIYKDPQAVYGDPSVQGSTIALNVLRADGTMVGYSDVEAAADDQNIYVRSGSLCNPGGVATYLNWSPAEMRAAFAAGHRCSHPTQIVHGKATGVVRVSMGAMSTSADVNGFINFLKETYLDCESDTSIARSVDVSQRSVQQIRTVPIASGTETLPSARLHSSGTLHVPQSQPRPSSGHPSTSSSTQSDIARSWERGPVANNAAPTHGTRSYQTIPSPSDQCFPGRLARRAAAEPVPGRIKGLDGGTGLSGIEIKVEKVQKHSGHPDHSKITGGAKEKSKKAFGLKHLLHRSRSTDTQLQ